jgi:hypothetical protein
MRIFLKDKRLTAPLGAAGGNAGVPSRHLIERPVPLWLSPFDQTKITTNSSTNESLSVFAQDKRALFKRVVDAANNMLFLLIRKAIHALSVLSALA